MNSLLQAILETQAQEGAAKHTSENENEVPTNSTFVETEPVLQVDLVSETRNLFSTLLQISYLSNLVFVSNRLQLRKKKIRQTCQKRTQKPSMFLKKMSLSLLV